MRQKDAFSSRWLNVVGSTRNDRNLVLTQPIRIT
jgi:hypothetical protein